MAQHAAAAMAMLLPNAIGKLAADLSERCEQLLEHCEELRRGTQERHRSGAVAVADPFRGPVR